MAGVEESNLRVRYIFAEGFRSRGNEKRIALPQMASKGGFDWRKYS
jgi:hypothetical protein